MPTAEPIRFTGDIVGSTCTLVASMFRSSGESLSPEMAGLLLGGLVSDTLLLKSPTAAELDFKMCEWLEKVSGVKGGDLMEELLKIDSPLASKPAGEVLNADRKNYTDGNIRFALAQVEESNLELLHHRRDELSEEIRNAVEELIQNFNDIDLSRKSADSLCDILQKCELPLAKKILKSKDMLAKKTFWMFGGDGWAYDIGFGGLDHVVASGENINVLVVDTEVYSNTGGQSSKATPIGAVAQFASSGKASPKKDLGAIFMTYGNVYVAQVAMGADPNQLIKAVREAEEFDGPSVIIAYTPCLSHGLKCGMGGAQEEMKRAVEAGYWTLYRYNPSNEKPFTLDSKAPSASYTEFLAGETRYAALKRTFPDNAAEFFAKGAEAAEKKYQNYKRMEDNQ